MFSASAGVRIDLKPAIPVSLSARGHRMDAVAKLYITCLNDAAIGIAAQRAMIAAHPGTEVIEIASGHSPFLSMPERLSEILEDAAR